MNALRLYARMIAHSIRGQMQYRANLAMLSFGYAATSLIEYLGMWALFDRFGALSGWTLAEAGVFYGMGNIAFALCEMFMREFDTFHHRVKSGDFDRVLLRPRSTVLQMLGAQCQLMRTGRLLQGAAVLAVSLSALDMAWGVDRWCLMGLSILGGGMLFGGIIVLQATSTFWTIESLEIWNSITFGGVTIAQYPLDIYQKPLRYLFTYLVPLVAMSYWPCAYLLGRGHAPVWLSWTSPLVGLGFFGLSLAVWRFGVRHYRSTGS